MVYFGIVEVVIFDACDMTALQSMFVNKGKDAVCGGSEYGVMRWDVCKCVNVWCEKSVIEVEGMWCWDVGVGCVID